MLIRREARVGLVVFLAILTLIAIYWFLGGLSLRASTYPIYAVFRDAQKLDRGSDVRMAGVKIGTVAGATLTPDSRARVEMLIEKGTKIPVDSLARITTGGLIGENYMEIVPGSSDQYLDSGDRIASAPTVEFDELMTQASDLLDELQTTAETVNQVLGDKELVASIKSTVSNLDRATRSADQMLKSTQALLNEARPEINRTFRNLSDASENALGLSRQLQEAFETEARPNFRGLMADTRLAVQNLNATILQAQALLGGFGGTSEQVNQALARAATLAERAEEITTNLAEATAGVRDITTDPELQCNIKEITRNLVTTTQQAEELLTSLNRKFGGTTCPPTPEQRSAVPGYGLTANALWNTDDGDYRFDANYTWLADPDSFYRIGAYNIGENTRLNLQGGMILDPRNAFRYGLYASRLGVGYDYRLTRNMRLSADLFRPNEPELELRGIWDFSRHFSLYGGLQDVFESDNRDILLGVQYRK